LTHFATYKTADETILIFTFAQFTDINCPKIYGEVRINFRKFCSWNFPTEIFPNSKPGFLWWWRCYCWWFFYVDSTSPMRAVCLHSRQTTSLLTTVWSTSTLMTSLRYFLSPRLLGSCHWL